MEASIALKEITKRYHFGNALNQVSLGVERGTRFGIVGPSGAGKSTLLEILATLVKPDSGTVFIHGMPLHENSKQVREISGYVPEQATLNPRGTVFENLRTHGILYGLTSKRSAVRARQLLDRFGLREHAQDFPGMLSPSQRRLLVFCRAILPQPELLYMDETTTLVDYPTSSLIWEELYRQDDGMTVCFATKSVSEAEKYADRYVVLHRGKVLTDRLHEDIRHLIQRDTEYYLRLSPPSGRTKALLESISTVYALEMDGDQMKFHLERSSDFLAVIDKIGHEAIEDMRVIEPDLNRIILDFTREEFPEE